MVQNKNFFAKSSYSAPLLFHAVAAGSAARAAAARAAAGAAASAAVCIYDVDIGGALRAPLYVHDKVHTAAEAAAPAATLAAAALAADPAATA